MTVKFAFQKSHAHTTALADRKPTGRPPLQRGDPSVSVHIRVPGSQYDRLEQQAHAARVGIPELIRRRLADDDDESGDD
jgi:hypothetical protein